VKPQFVPIFMTVNRLIDSLDQSLTNLSLRVGPERNYLISFLFHGLFAGTDELASGTVDPQQAITVDMFRTLVGHFKSHSYRFVSPMEIAQGLVPEGKYVLLTFDDGYYNNVRALPVLEEFDVPAVFFISTSHVKEQKAFWWDVVYRDYWKRNKQPSEMERVIADYKLLKTDEVESHLKKAYGNNALRPVGDLDRPFSSSELREFAKHKCVFLGNHTTDHAILPNYSRTEIYEQINGAQEDLKEIAGQVPTIIAYPSGGASTEIHQIAREAGLNLGIGVRPGRNQLPVKMLSRHAMSLRRFTVWGNRQIEQQCRMSRSAISLYRLFQELKHFGYAG
jgi:peptidoglycan/xylan/chitin deacetylase (PgdA/CDA1 family)